MAVILTGIFDRAWFLPFIAAQDFASANAYNPGVYSLAQTFQFTGSVQTYVPVVSPLYVVVCGAMGGNSDYSLGR
jgi:hypothetical protein